MFAIFNLAMTMVGLAAAIAWLFTRRQRTSSSATAALVLGVAGALIFVDGFRLAVVEENRTRYGRVVTGVVEDLRTSDLSSTSPLKYSELTTYEQVCRFLLTRSPEEWVVHYSYPCAGMTGSCSVHEQVTRDLWMRLNLGQPIAVRQSIDEKYSARLDDNPQRGLALVKVALACVLLALSGFVTGRFTLSSRQKYIEVDGVVTSVERIQYGDEMRWKVRFAYFDDQGNAQDSVDEVNDPLWKSGDGCRAVYSPKTPDLATLRPRLTSV